MFKYNIIFLLRQLELVKIIQTDKFPYLIFSIIVLANALFTLSKS